MSIAELLTNSIEQNDTKYLRRLNKKIMLDSEKAAVDWVLEYEKKYSAVPTLKRMKDEGTHAPYISRTLSGSPLKDLFERAVSKMIARYALNSHSEMEEILNSTNVFPVNEYMKVAKMLAGISVEESTSIHTLDRGSMYSGEDLSTAISSGIDYVDESTGGTLAGEVQVWVARTGVGKTLVLCTQAVRLARMGHRVLIMSLEMLPKQLAHRIDATLGKFNPKVFRDSRPDALDVREKKLPVVQAELKHIASRGGDIIFTERHIRSLEGLKRTIEEVKPDVVMIDGLYLVRSDDSAKGSASWEKIKQVSNETKQLALETSLPFIVTTQFSRSGSGSESRQDLTEIGGSDAIAQDADTVIGLYKEPNGNVVGKTLKVRNGESGGEFELELDWSVMEVRSVYHAPVVVTLRGKAGVLAGTLTT